MKCQLCNQEFNPKTNCQKFCDIGCQEIYSKKLKIFEARVEGGNKICIRCNNEYKPYFYNSDKQKYCSANCRHLDAKNPKNQREKIHNKVCLYCSEQYMTASHNSNFCNTNCRMEYHKKNWRLKTQEIRKVQERVCSICEKIFTPKKSLRQIYCSKRCREKVTKKIYKMLSTCYKSTNQEIRMKQLGYSPKELLEHLQTFDNWDKLKNSDWHLDHKIPIAAFVRNGVTDPSIICKLENLQPLNGKENCSKGDKFDQVEFEKYMKQFF